MTNPFKHGTRTAAINATQIVKDVVSYVRQFPLDTARDIDSQLRSIIQGRVKARYNYGTVGSAGDRILRNAKRDLKKAGLI